METALLRLQALLDLIDTLWNVKVKNREIFAQGTDDLIDTLWNVKFYFERS